MLNSLASDGQSYSVICDKITAPGAAKQVARAEKKVEEEEEDVDMGGLFGGDDDDYGCEEDSAPYVPPTKPVAVAKPKPPPTIPSLSQVISLQSSEGVWIAAAKSTLA